MNWLGPFFLQVVAQSGFIALLSLLAVLLPFPLSMVPIVGGLWFAWRILHNPDHFYTKLAAICALGAVASVTLGGVSKIDFAYGSAKVVVDIGANAAISISLIVAAVIFAGLQLFRDHGWLHRTSGIVSLNANAATVVSLPDCQYRGRAPIEVRNGTDASICLTGASVWHVGFFSVRWDAELVRTIESFDAPSHHTENFILESGKTISLTAIYEFQSRTRCFIVKRWPSLLGVLDALSCRGRLRLEALQPSARKEAVLRVVFQR